MWERLNVGKVKREKALSGKVLIGESWFDDTVHDPLRVLGVDLLLVTLLHADTLICESGNVCLRRKIL